MVVYLYVFTIVALTLAVMGYRHLLYRAERTIRELRRKLREVQ